MVGGSRCRFTEYVGVGVMGRNSGKKKKGKQRRVEEKIKLSIFYKLSAINARPANKEDIRQMHQKQIRKDQHCITA